MGYKDLKIWQLARSLAVDIHRMTLRELPKFEMYETGSQIRRSSKAVRTNIVEGYGRRRYKGDFIKFIVYASSSNSETLDHLESLYETESLKNRELYFNLHERNIILGKTISKFLQSIDNNHRT